ncbi:MAG TPA: glycosyltransferase family 2 protein, partial [Vicinamibacterales bacterium]|nr:glycosyltransferase family 2 protein [Vicinamibacterales bacterium]
ETLGVLSSDSRVRSFELIVVDDGSRDGTAEIANRLAAQHATVRVIHHSVNRGFGGALRSGFSASRGELVSAISADGELPPDQILTLLGGMGDADLILGRRERTVNAFRKSLTFGLNILMRLVLGFVPDSTAIYIVRGDLLRRMDLQSNTGLANLEVLLYCRHWHRRIATGVTWTRPRLSGESKVTNVRTMWRTFVEMVRLRGAIRRRAAAA